MTHAGASCVLSLRPQTVDFDQTWNQISDTANKVIMLAPVPKPEWNDRFHDVYKLCVAFPGLANLQLLQIDCDNLSTFFLQNL